jgi:hypothetical protein
LRKRGVTFGAMKGESLRHTVANFMLDADVRAAAEGSMLTAHVGKLLVLCCSTKAVADRDQIRSLLPRHLRQSSLVLMRVAAIDTGGYTRIFTCRLVACSSGGSDVSMPWRQDRVAKALEILDVVV